MRLDKVLGEFTSTLLVDDAETVSKNNTASRPFEMTGGLGGF